MISVTSPMGVNSDLNYLAFVCDVEEDVVMVIVEVLTSK